MTDTTPDIDSYCCSTHCINCKNRLLRRLPISRSKNRRYSDYSVSRQRIEIYASLPLCNNPFHYGLLYAQDTDAPKLCASCAKHFRAYLKVYGSSLAKKRLASETGETCAFRPEAKPRKIGSVVVQWDDDYNMFNHRWNQGQDIKTQCGAEYVINKQLYCVLCGLCSDNSQITTKLRIYNTKVGKDVLESVRSDSFKFLKMAFCNLSSRKKEVTSEYIAQKLQNSNNNDMMCGNCVQEMRRQRDRAEKAQCSV